MFFGSFSSFIYVTLISLPGIIIALAFHEFAHAYVAVKLGDPTPRSQGRLTLYPGAHLDFIGFIFIILTHFGWGKPVQISSSYFKHPKRDIAMCAVAGPAMNILVAFIMGVLLKLCFFINITRILGSGTSTNLQLVLEYGLMINVYIAIFNLIPIPPLDGFDILMAIVKVKTGKIVQFLYRYGTIILLIGLVTSLINYIISPLASFIIWLIWKITFITV